MDPPIEGLLDKVDSKFTLVALGAARARQVNAYYNSLGEGLGRVVPPQVTSVSGKPLSIAFEEISAGKATYSRPDPDELLDEEAAALELAAGEIAVLEAVADELAVIEEAEVLEEIADEIVEDVAVLEEIEVLEEIAEEIAVVDMVEEALAAEAAAEEPVPDEGPSAS
jgi:DNA-directed RNA polymerase subunit omega